MAATTSINLIDRSVCKTEFVYCSILLDNKKPENRSRLCGADAHEPMDVGDDDEAKDGTTPTGNNDDKLSSRLFIEFFYKLVCEPVILRPA